MRSDSARNLLIAGQSAWSPVADYRSKGRSRCADAGIAAPVLASGSKNEAGEMGI